MNRRERRMNQRGEVEGGPQVTVRVEGPAEYNGVRVDHPSIISAIKNLAAQGKNTEYIMRIVGMPAEIVTKYMREERNSM